MSFRDNGDGAISDLQTGLTWVRTPGLTNKSAFTEARASAAACRVGGHADWRPPNAKELQSIVDYSRAPDATDAAQRGPAIDPVFQITEAESYFWTSTTHLDSPGPRFGAEAVYVCFGRAPGNLAAMGGEGGSPRWTNVHGAGAQRSDPKSGDPPQPRWASGRGPQGDDVRIYHCARCVRGGLTGP